MRNNYRIGLRLLNDEAYLVYARDLTHRHTILMATGRSIEYLATVLYAKLLANEQFKREQD